MQILELPFSAAGQGNAQREQRPKAQIQNKAKHRKTQRKTAPGLPPHRL